MALQAGNTVVLVTGNCLVILVRVCLIMFMAVNATENGIISRINMAFRAGAPFSIVTTRIDREILGIVVECRRFPGGLSVAGLAFRRELGRSVRRIRRLVIIVQVTADASIRSVGVIPVMTGSAIGGNTCVSPQERVIVIVDRELGRRPPGVGSMTSLTDV